MRRGRTGRQGARAARPSRRAARRRAGLRERGSRIKAVQFAEYGGPEVLRVVDIEAPRPGPGEVRIAVRAAGVNPSDWKRRAGLYRAFDVVAFPSGVGVEASGIVDEIGPGVTNVSIGDAVFGMGRSTVAQQAILTHWVRKPDDLSFEVAGGLSVIIETALRSLDDLGVRPGETLLVSGASGGIGSAVLQIARSRGIAVIGTASVRNQAYLRELGAMPTPYGTGLKDRVRALAAHGVDAALDVAGSGIVPELIDIVGEASRVVSVADFTASRHGARFSAGPPRDPDRVLAEAARLCGEGHFRLRIDRLFPLERTAEAHEVSARGHVAGKLVITVP
nr:NADP-dependent oxidoreductase [Ancylobacter defluvii]